MLRTNSLRLATGPLVLWFKLWIEVDNELLFPRIDGYTFDHYLSKCQFLMMTLTLKKVEGAHPFSLILGNMYCSSR